MLEITLRATLAIEIIALGLGFSFIIADVKHASRGVEVNFSVGGLRRKSSEGVGQVDAFDDRSGYSEVDTLNSHGFGVGSVMREHVFASGVVALLDFDVDLGGGDFDVARGSVALVFFLSGVVSGDGFAMSLSCLRTCLLKLVFF